MRISDWSSDVCSSDLDEPVLQCSPRRRTHETAMYIAQSCGSDPEIIPALDEIDFGEWSGRAFESLKDRDDWRRWNETRGQSRQPGGERIIEVQSRIADHFDEMRRTVPEGTVVMVSHADVIRAAVCHVLGLSPDNWQRFEITPGSISRIAAEAEGYRLLSLNEVWL